MQATEETLYNQPILHKIFAVASVGMLISIVWMIAADHYRPWKRAQRDFHKIEDRKLKAVAAEKLAEQKSKSQTRIDEINALIKQAEADSVRRSSDLRRVNQDLNRLGGRVERLNTDHQFKKTELDGLRTLYDGMIQRGEQAEAQTFLETKVAAAERQVGDLARELEAARAEKLAKDQEKEALLGGVDDLVKERERLTRESPERGARPAAARQAQHVHRRLGQLGQGHRPRTEIGIVECQIGLLADQGDLGLAAQPGLAQAGVQQRGLCARIGSDDQDGIGVGECGGNRLFC